MNSQKKIDGNEREQAIFDPIPRKLLTNGPINSTGNDVQFDEYKA